jgi:hypothetical protein
MRRLPILVLPWLLLRSAEVAAEAPPPSSGRFLLGALSALPGGDADVLVTGESAGHDAQIATLSAGRATWWIGDDVFTAVLPRVSVRGARFSRRGDALLVGPGAVDLATRTFRGDPSLSAPHGPPPPSGGHVELRAASWSEDGNHVALLYGWTGPSLGVVPPEEVRLARRGEAGVTWPAPGAADVRIVGDHVVVAMPEIALFDLEGRRVAVLPRRGGAPLRLEAWRDGAAAVDADGTIRLIDVKRRVVRAVWRGPFHDVAAVPGRDALIANTLGGRVRAACLAGDVVREIGAVDTGLLDARIEVTRDDRLVFAAAGAAPMHVAPFTLECPP